MIPPGYTETQYISESLTKIKSFCLKYQAHLFLVAHPTKLQKDKATGKYEIPTLYSISGSANFYNKADFGLVMHRGEDDASTLYVDKVRFDSNGGRGQVEFNYSKERREYYSVGSFSDYHDMG